MRDNIDPVPEAFGNPKLSVAIQNSKFFSPRTSGECDSFSVLNAPEKDPLTTYYETCWATRHEAFSGQRQGYAGNFRKWMHAELKGIKADSKLLEVGCGDASFTQHLAKYGCDITGIDISAGQIAHNARRFPY